MPGTRRQQRPAATIRRPIEFTPLAQAPLLETALARSFELVAGFGLLALLGVAIVVVLIPNSASGRVGFAMVLVGIGLALVVLALALSRRSAAAVKRPLEALDEALAAITAGDLSVRVALDGAAAEIQFVGTSVNSMVRELTRLRVIEIERKKDQEVRRELAEVVHASLDRRRVVQCAVEVVGKALEVDRAHIRLAEQGHGPIVAEWCRSAEIAAITPLAPDDELAPLAHLLGPADNLDVVVIDDAREHARFPTEQRDALACLSIRAALKYPIVVGPRVVGVLVVSEQGTSRPWTGGEVGLMEAFAREIGRALDHARAFELQQQMNERLGVLDRAKNEFLAEVSRELRGPLASILGYIEILSDESGETVTEEQRKMLSVVARGGEKLLVLISDLLMMSQLEGGQSPPRLAPVYVAKVVQRVCESVAPAVINGDLDLIVDVESGINLVADERQIERALHNVVSNAVRFTPRGGRVEIRARSEYDSTIAIEVLDTGCGIPPEDQAEIFSRFFTASGPRRRETFGAGLGLYIVKQIIDGHEGRVDVASEPGSGTTFTIRLPRRSATAGRRADDRARRNRPVDVNSVRS